MVGIIKDENKQAICDLYADGFSMYYIAKKFGVTVPTVKKYLLLSNYKIRSRKDYWHKSLPDELVERYKRGEITTFYISKVTCKHPLTVRKRLRRILNINDLRTIRGVKNATEQTDVQ